MVLAKETSFWKKLRLQWFLATHAVDCSVDFVSILYKIYLNHNKIIHFRNGYPVYSLSTPALFSKPAAHFISRALYKTIQNRNLPNMMSFAVNDICNATCEHCSFFEGVEEPGRAVLSLAESQKFIQDSQELGVSVINFVGGEPLMREDLPDIIKSVDQDLSTTVLFTNGWYLEERVKELKKAGLDSIYISLDAANAKDHDKFRGKEGLFARAIQGVKKAKDLGFSVGFSCTITPESYFNDGWRSLIELGKKIGVHEVLIFDALPTGRYDKRSDLIDSGDWVEAMIQAAKYYNQRDEYPGITFYSYGTSHRSVGCACGTSYFYMSPYGDMMSCDFNHAKFGNIKEEPLWKIWQRLSTLPEFCQAKWGGCKIKDADYRTSENVCGSHQESRPLTRS
ncbi:radical SAM/SPASM domain-containing protein [[Limnothrix rosea] IAM M-220]|uniref:radical SAM/SPASM domain-containing protein n=1 Tax=[Limnothrix rosea] IAM M-220 TaxID=454133 RepID=UPI000959DD7A|nr:radical SAM protein [[Limnothrix rosea] IAM M-220]OKH12528.1 radical SAM protein [[Limnothrix rosea] IAM M-220]